MNKLNRLWAKSGNVIYALRGLRHVVVHEFSFGLHLIIFAVALVLAIVFKFTHIEWAIVLIGFGVEFFSEIINTAIEELADFVHPESHPSIGRIKDIAAAGVLLLSAMNLIAFLVILFPKIWPNGV
jgi:undecaprenol kinase